MSRAVVSRRAALSAAALAAALAAAALAAALGCAPAPTAPRRAAAPAAGALWRYAVAAGPGAAELAVEAAVPAGPARRLTVEEGAEPFLRDVIVEPAGGAPLAVELDRGFWFVPPCPAGGCRVRYRFHLADAARALEDPGYAAEHGGALLAPPSTWLLYPFDAEEGRFRLHVTTPEGVRFVTGLYPAPDEPSTYEATLGDLPMSPYSAFGPIEVRDVATAGGTVRIGLLPGATDVGDRAVVPWITEAAGAVSGYYGRFPVPHALVLVVPTGGRGTGFASALGHGGASIITRVGRATTGGDLEGAWEMTHEMIHLAFPNVGRRHAWLEEGLATYVEPIARARAGVIAPSAVWRDLARGLPKGLPMPGDRGLDNTPTWGRTYWGGALFCLLADLEIRERTGNTRSLDDALRGILAAGGSIAVRWKIERALAAGDDATGVTVLQDLYARMKDAPVGADLDALWQRLGVGFRRGEVLFDDGAPLARIRASITAPAATAGRSSPVPAAALR